MAELSSDGRLADIREDYLALTRRKRLYSGILLSLFVALMASGFMIADARNAGGFWDGIANVFVFPKIVIAEAWEKRAELPAHVVEYFPALLETINIAAVSTLIGTLIAVVLSMLSTRGRSATDITNSSDSRPSARTKYRMGSLTLNKR